MLKKLELRPSAGARMFYDDAQAMSYVTESRSKTLIHISYKKRIQCIGGWQLFNTLARGSYCGELFGYPVICAKYIPMDVTTQ